jgi:hypothetical protein
MLATCLLVACGDDGTGPGNSIEGEWSGPIGSAQLTLTLQESDGEVSGNGSIVADSESAALTVDGSFDDPDFSLTLSPPGFEPINFAGEVDEDEMNGTLNGSGFVQQTVTLTRAD